MKGLEVLSARYGKNARCVGVKMHRVAKEVIGAIKDCESEVQNDKNKLWVLLLIIYYVVLIFLL